MSLPAKAQTITSADGAVTSLHVYAVQIIEDSVFTTWDGMTGFSGITYPATAGVIFCPHTTAITLASGKIVAYSEG